MFLRLYQVEGKKPQLLTRVRATLKKKRERKETFLGPPSLSFFGKTVVVAFCSEQRKWGSVSFAPEFGEFSVCHGFFLGGRKKKVSASDFCRYCLSIFFNFTTTRRLFSNYLARTYNPLSTTPIFFSFSFLLLLSKLF